MTRRPFMTHEEFLAVAAWPSRSMPSELVIDVEAFRSYLAALNDPNRFFDYLWAMIKIIRQERVYSRCLLRGLTSHLREAEKPR